MRPRSLSLVFASLVALLGGVSHAAPADPYDAARDAEGRLDYKAVITSATKALDMPNSHDRLVDLYQMLGTAQAVLGHEDEAIDAFQRLLAIDPDHRLPRGLSPKITKPFKEAGGYWIDRPGGLAIKPDLPREIGGGKPITVSVKLDDPLQMAATVRMSWRHEGEPDYKKMEENAGGGGITLAIPTGGINFTIPADQIPVAHADYNIEIYFTALSAKGGELRSAGDPAHPLFVTVRALRDLEPVGNAENGQNNALVASDNTSKKKQQPAYLKKWWFWTAVGGGVAVAAVLGGTLGWYYGRDTSHVDINLTTKTAP